MVGALKIAEEGDDLIVRVSETIGRGAAAVVRFPEWDRIVSFDIGPFEIRTFRVPAEAALPVVETDLLERAIDPV